jgi:hypothetical protein
MSSSIAEHRTTERRHMIVVKDALATALDTSPVDAGAILACVDYLGYIIGRFNAQGRANVDRLLPLIKTAGSDSDEKIVADIAGTISRTERELELLIAAATAFRNTPDGDLPKLLRAGHRFVAFYDAVLARRKESAQDIISRYFDGAEYWSLTDDVTPASIETEKALFRRTGKGDPG